MEEVPRKRWLSELKLEIEPGSDLTWLDVCVLLKKQWESVGDDTAIRDTIASKVLRDKEGLV